MPSPGPRSSPPPLWALVVGALAAGVCAFLLVGRLPAQVEAFALGAIGSPSRLMVPLGLGNGLTIIGIWGGLALIFRRAFERRRQTLYVWLAVIAWASLTVSALSLFRVINLVRIEADRAAQEASRRQAAAIKGVIAGFPDAADRELVSAAFREITSWSDPIRGLRETRISRDPQGRWEALCGEASFKDGAWAGIVTWRKADAPPRSALQQDGFDSRKQKTCLPIVEKYVGVEGVDMKAYVSESTALGCTDIDIYYWEAWKTWCRGRITRPTP